MPFFGNQRFEAVKEFVVDFRYEIHKRGQHPDSGERARPTGSLKHAARREFVGRERRAVAKRVGDLMAPHEPLAMQTFERRSHRVWSDAALLPDGVVHFGNVRFTGSPQLGQARQFELTNRGQGAI